MADALDSAVVSREFIPGTVHLVDLEGTVHAQHAEGGNHDIVLVPAPSADPDDPLNWSPRRKALSTVCVNVYVPVVCATMHRGWIN